MPKLTKELVARCRRGAEAFEEHTAKWLRRMGHNINGRGDLARMMDTSAAFTERQTEKGKAGATARWSGNEAREALASIINDLATRTDALGDWLPPAELWPELHSAMDSRDLAPVETTNAYSYGDGEEITYVAFRRRIQRARQ